jgi:hypothetical protein
MRRLLAAVLLLIAGCASGARPPAVDTGAARRTGLATSPDVEIVARAGAWRGWPSDLARFVTPIHVTVVNLGTVPVRVSHDDFALTLAGDRQLGSVLPTEVRGTVYQPPPSPLSSAGFLVSGESYRRERDWVAPGSAWNAAADPVARVGEPFALPSPDVLDRALREDVLQPGGTASGFVYFERGPPAGQVELTVRLVDAWTGRGLGRAVVPLMLP